MTRLHLTVSGMDCTGCEQRISTVLTRLDGITLVEVDHRSGSVVVEYDPAAVAEATISERLAVAGYETIGGANP